MKTFKQYLNEFTIRKYTGTNGFYAWLNVATDSLDDIRKYFPELKFSAEEILDLHVTVMYSKKAIPATCVNENKKMPDAQFIQAVRAKSVEFWGGHSDKGYLVLKLQPDNIKHLHDKWKVCGAEPTFPDYTPHMTLKTPCNDNLETKRFIKKYNEKLNEEPLQITLIQEQVEDISND